MTQIIGINIDNEFVHTMVATGQPRERERGGGLIVAAGATRRHLHRPSRHVTLPVNISIILPGSMLGVSQQIRKRY